MIATQETHNLSSSKPKKPTWRQFDVIEPNHHFSQLLVQIVNHLVHDNQDIMPKDSYFVHPLVEKLEQLTKSKAKHLLTAIDHIRFYSMSSELRKRLPSFRLKPSNHCIEISNSAVNKQYTIKITLHNKSAFPAHWRVLTPHQDRQSVFFCCHPTSGVLEPQRYGMLTVELVLLDARDFHRLLALETVFAEQYRTVGAIMIHTDIGKYPNGATITNETDVGDLDLESCYWHIPSSKLKPLVPSSQEANHTLPSTHPETSIHPNPNTRKLKTSDHSEATTSSALEHHANSESSRTSTLTDPRSTPPNGTDAKVHENPALPPGANFALYGVPVHVRLVPLTTELDESEFWNEVNVMSSLRHPHLVNLLGAASFGQVGHLVSRAFDHGSLRSFFQDKDAYREHKTLTFKVEMLTATAKAINFVHANDRLHRAISAEHVFLTDDFDVKLSVPQLLLRDSLTNRYRHSDGDEAPEVLSAESWSEAADVYSFGLVMWEVFNEQRPIRTPQEQKDGYMPPISDTLAEHLKEEAAERHLPPTVVDSILSLISSCTAIKALDRPNSDLVLQELAKIHEMLAHQRGILPTAQSVHRRTREHSIDPRLRKSSELSRGPSISPEISQITPTKPQITIKKHKKSARPATPDPIVISPSDDSLPELASQSKMDKHLEETEPGRISVELVREKAKAKKKHHATPSDVTKSSTKKHHHHHHHHGVTTDTHKKEAGEDNQ